MIPPVRATPDPIDEILRRIARVESGGQGDYRARGPVVTRGAYRGQRALGRYQIMPGNLAAWSREAVGREVTPEEFLASPDLQERIARHRVSAYYAEYPNAADVASLWHSGRPLSQAGNARDVNMTTREYVRRVTGEQPEQDRLERALRAAHAAGDTAAARRFAAEIVARREQEGETALAEMRMEQGGVPSDSAENIIRLRATYDPAQSGEASAGPIGQARAKWERGETLTPDEAEVLGFASPTEARHELARERARLRGRESVRPEDREGFNAAAVVQGFGSGLFGLGTPGSAVGEFIASRLDDEPGESAWGESLQFARGRRDQLRESHPGEFYTGMGLSLIGGAGVARAAGRAAPSVFALRSGQTARNIARLSATGAAAGGVMALNEEGTGAVPMGVVAGGIAGPAAAGALRGVDAAAGRLSPTNTAIRMLARRLGEPVESLQARYDEFVRIRGRPPRLVEIVRRETSEELGQISRVRSGAGDVFRQAEEESARALPGELAPLVRAGGAVSSEPFVAARHAATAREAADVVGRRVRSTATRQIGVKGTRDGGQRGRSMDALMNRIGEHRVPVTDEMLEVVEDPDVVGALSPVVRRGLRRALDAVPEGETPYLRVRDWDVIRQELGRRARTETGRRYSQLRTRVREYVGGAVPEYERGLQEFARRSATARGTEEGAQVLRRTTREFADRIRPVGVPEQAGVRVGARTAIADALGGEPAKAERFMTRLARDAGMRERVRMALRPDEAEELTRLAERYGHQLDFSAGLRTGRSVLKQSDTEAFQDAVAMAGGVERAGVRQGTRAVLTEAAGESPAAAARTARRMAEDPGLQVRISTALGSGERQRLTTLGQSVTESQSRMAAAVPGDATLARMRTAEQADGIREVIRGSAALSGRGGGGFVSAFVGEMLQKVRIPKVAARRLAEMATDPSRAHLVIARLRRAGMQSEEILQLYRDAAAAAGIQAGRSNGSPDTTTIP